MADTITSLTLIDGEKELVVKRINQSDASGQQDATFVDASAFPRPSDSEATTSFLVTEIQYSIQGFTSVVLEFDASTDVPFAVLSGNGIQYFSPAPGIQDPENSGTTGDILVTTNGATASATYDITIYLTKRFG